MGTIGRGEEILAIAEDADSYKPGIPLEYTIGELPCADTTPPMPEKILFCGWRRDVRDLFKHLDNVVQPGTEIHVISAFLAVEKRNQFLLDEGLDVTKLKRIKLVH